MLYVHTVTPGVVWECRVVVVLYVHTVTPGVVWECRVVVVLYVHTVTPGVVRECSGGGCVVCTYSDTWCCLGV